MNTPLITNLLRALLRWWWLIALSVALSVGVGYMLQTEQEALYIGNATVIIGNDPDNPAPTAINGDYLNGYAILLRRNSTLQPVIDDLGLDITVGELLQRMEIFYDVYTGLINVTITDNDADRAARIANSVVNELIDQTSDRATALDLEFVNDQIADIQRQITELQKRYNELVDESGMLTSAFDLQQNINERTSIETTILDLRTLLIDLVENAPRSEVQIFEPAVPNYFPVAANSVTDLIIAGAGGGILAIVLILMFTFFDDRLQWNEHRRDTILGFRVLGPLGIVPRHKLPLYVDTMSESVEAEALRQVRAKITLAAGGVFPNVLTVLSYDSGDGKTVTSSNLALETARNGANTLIIDGDMRRGDLHEVFRLPNVFGLSNVLASEESFRDLMPKALLESGYENLTLMPFGRTESDPAALLSGPRLPRLIDFLGEHFDAIIFDAAPTIGGSDAVFLGENSTGVIIVVNTRRTRLPALQRTIDSLKEGQDINILGVAYNRVRLQVTTRYNNYYYRQTPGAMQPQRLSKQMNRPRSGLRAFAAQVILDRKTSERMLSLSASAAHLGVRKETIKNWLASGYLKAERRYMRRWIRTSMLDTMLEDTISHSASVTAHIEPEEGPEPARSSSVNGSNDVPDALRQQREAILGFANQPDTSEAEI